MCNYRNAAGVLGDLTYQYHAAGNRTRIGGSFAPTALPDPVGSSEYDAANPQLSFGEKTLAYDANGNLTSIAEPGGMTTLTWDARNRLISVNRPGLTAFVHLRCFRPANSEKYQRPPHRVPVRWR